MNFLPIEAEKKKLYVGKWLSQNKIRSYLASCALPIHYHVHSFPVLFSLYFSCLCSLIVSRWVFRQIVSLRKMPRFVWIVHSVKVKGMFQNIGETRTKFSKFFKKFKFWVLLFWKLLKFHWKVVEIPLESCRFHE